MKYKESVNMELRREINANFKKKIVAFANCDGGTILVGIEDEGNICGVRNPEKTMERISNVIRDGIHPLP